MTKTQNDIENKIREIVTYHSDDGTSGYLLDEGRIEKIVEAIQEARDRAVLDYILSLGWQDTENEYVKEVLEDADKIAKDL